MVLKIDRVNNGWVMQLMSEGRPPLVMVYREAEDVMKAVREWLGPDLKVVK